MTSKAPVDVIEGIGGLQLTMQGVWRFYLRNHYEQEFIVGALMVPQVGDVFLLGVNIMTESAAAMDFETSEMTWTEQGHTYIMPFMTWQQDSAMRKPAQVRLVHGKQLQQTNHGSQGRRER